MILKLIEGKFIVVWSLLMISWIDSIENFHHDQPRIVSLNGNLIFQTGSSYNISFKSSDGGSINFNGESFQALISMIKQHHDQLQQIISGTFAMPSTTLSRRVDENQAQIEELQRKVSILSTTSTGNRRLTRKVENLERRIEDIVATLSANECNSNPCANGGTCIDLYNSFVCKCPEAWTGPRCSEDVNECATLAGTDLGCQNGATCVNTQGGFRCLCPENRFGSRCTEAIDDCLSSSNEALCGHGTCQNLPRTQSGQAKYKCHCDPGWKTDGVRPMCDVDVDECTIGRFPCSSNPLVTCSNTPGSFVCGPCPTGFSGNGFTCSDVNECHVDNGGCSKSPWVECINTPGSRTCGPCPGGYQGNGVICVFAGLCSIDNGGCHPLATCVETPGIGILQRRCICREGYIGNGEGANGCVHQVGPVQTPCTNNPCVHGTCQNLARSYMCHCFDGWTGPTCNVPVSACGSNPCQNGATCSDLPGGLYTCACTAEYTGPHCEEVRQECGGSFEDHTGRITFPLGGSLGYPNGVTCFWFVKTTPDKVLSIHFERFRLERHEDCAYDFLQLYDGDRSDDHVIGRYCGNELVGRTLNTTSHQVAIMFHSDHSETDEGFSLTWSSHSPECGGLIQENHGVIKSPGYPGNYPLGRNCVWYLRAEPGNYFLFALGQIDVGSCNGDYLEIRDGWEFHSPLLGNFCSSVVPPPVQTTANLALVNFYSDDNEPHKGFQISFFQKRVVQCGGKLTSDHGEIMSPNYPALYTHHVHCVWVITVAEGEKILLNISHINIEDHSNCLYDYLEVREGVDDTGMFVGRYCGEVTPPIYFSTTNNLYIAFKTDESVAARGFHAGWTTVCGGTYTDATGEFHSPYFPEPYPSDKTCNYLVRQPQGTTIVLQFVNFTIEEAVNETHCLYDYVEVRDGPYVGAPSIGKYCGTGLPNPVMSSHSSMLITFVSDGSIENRGFKARYLTINRGTGDVEEDACGGVLRSASGSVNSPRHPQLYPPSTTCTWVITVAENSIIRLSFITFHLEFHRDCVHDYVELFEDVDRNNSLGRFCGHALPPIITSPGNTLVISFVTDHSFSHEGFSATYVSFNASSVCGGELRSSTGIIISPNYPGLYPNNKICEWVISMPYGRLILLNVTNFEMEASRQCMYDFLEVRNGGLSTSPLIGKYCDNEIPQVFRSFTNKMFLKMYSDGNTPASGFKITYNGMMAGCGGELTSSSGSFMSPNYPGAPYRHSECLWKISVSKGSRIKLHFVDYDFADCRTNYVEVKLHEHDHDMKRHCASIADYLESKENTMLIRLRVMRDMGRGFHAIYFTNCNNVIRKLEGSIESLNFPESYPPNLNCTWTIEAPRGNVILAKLTYFDLKDQGCHDYIEINNGHFTEKLCSNSSMLHDFNSTGTLMTVRFVSSNSLSNSPSGFRLDYRVVGCSGHLEGESGNVTSPNYPQPYHNSKECQWFIKTPPQTRVQLTIHDLDIEEHHSCEYDSLEVYGGYDLTSPMLTKLCHAHVGSQILSSTGNFMVLRFLTDSSNNGRGFSASWISLPNGCGGNFTAIKGVITSQNYPAEHDHDTDCIWIITVQQGSRVLLEFEDFDVEQGAGCQYDYVAGYMNMDFNNSEIFRICGEGMIGRKFYSNDNLLILRMRTDESVAKRGFKASYLTVCGGFRNTGEDGWVASPGWPNNYKQSENCSWTIMASSLERKITIHVTHLEIGDPNDNCTGDYLEVLDGSDLDAPPIVKLCGNRSPAPITTHGSSVTVRFISGAYQVPHRGGFYLTYSESSSSCGGEFMSQHGTINSPNYPENYPDEIECIWNISTSPGNKIQLHFETMDIESSADCENDYITLKDSRATSRKMCGTELPHSAMADNNLLITFRSDHNTSGLGFSAHYSAVYGGNLIGDSGRIASPLYPRLYPSSSDHTWIVTSSQNKKIRITFESMDLEQSSPSCYYDYLRVFDGGSTESRELGKFCGSVLPSPIETTSNQFTLKFLSDGSVSRSGFLLSWEAFDAIPGEGFYSSLVPSATLSPGQTPSPSCGGYIVIENSTQTIESPNFPQRYPPNLNCVWMLHSISGKFIKFQIVSISIESHPSCLYDVLEIYSGESESEERIGRFCGHHLAPPRSIVVAHSDFARVKFSTDGDTSSLGFSMNVMTTCDRILSASSGIVTSPGYPEHYSRNENCTSHITVQPGNVIELTFNSMAIAGTMPHCTEDYLEIFDGPDNMSSSTRFCGHAPPSLYQSTSNSIALLFVSNSDENTDGGFSIEYHVLQLSCGGEIDLRGEVSTGHVSSPHYPSRYISSADCIWNVVAPAESRIKLSFNPLFDIERHVQCEYDHVEVRDGSSENSPLIGRFCGSQKPDDIVSSGNFIWVRFRSDSSQTGYGFGALFSIAPCGGTISAAQGYVTSPNYPRSYPANISCLWTIIAPENHYLTFSFESMQIDDCNDSVIIRDFNTTGDVILTACGNRLFPARETSGNEAVIEFRSNAFNQSAGFKLNFFSIYEGCGGLEMGPSGIITSPGYPQPFARRRRCSWIIKVQESMGIKLSLEDIDLGYDYSYTCSDDYLLIKAGAYPDSPVSQRLCRSSYISEIYLPSSTMEIQLVSDEYNNGRGFKIEYSTQDSYTCSSMHDIVNQSIVFTSWVQQDYRPNARDCTWIIRDPNRENSTTTLIIEQLNINTAGQCSQDFIEVREGLVYEDPRMGKYCDSDRVPKFGVATSSNGMLVRWSSRYVVDQTISLKYKFSACGGYVTTSSTIANPEFPIPPTSDTNCVWTVVGPEGSVVKLAIETQANSGNSCDDAFLEMLNGDRFSSPLIMKVCESMARKLVRTQSNRARIRFFSKQGETSRLTFKINITFMTSGCGGILQAPEGSISSPSWPSNSNSSQSCFWKLKTRENFYLNLKFAEPFQLTDRCIGSYLEIKETPSIVRRICGTTRPNDIIVTSNEVDIRYQNWQNVSIKGFSLNYVSDCGWNFTGQIGVSGEIYPPGYPGYYENNLNCTYYVITEPYLYTVLYLDVLRLPYDLGDCKDYLLISSLEKDSQPKKLCYSMYNINVVIPGTTSIRFVSDEEDNVEAWKLQYNIIDCNRQLTDEYGRLSSPLTGVLVHFPLNCSWTISAPADKIIKIKFHGLRLSYSSNCDSAHLSFTEFQPNGTSRFLGKFCGSDTLQPLYSTTSKLQVVYDAMVNAMGSFEIDYMAVYGCGGVVSNPSGTIVSLDVNNDGNYEANLDCKWIFDAPSNKLYELNFEYVTLPEDNHLACEDYVEVKAGFLENDEEVLKQCTSRGSFRYVSPFPAFLLEFVSDGETEARGFKATYNLIEQTCGGELSTNFTQRTITSPGYPSNYDIDLICRWIIQSPPHTYIEVDITSLDLYPSVHCQEDYLKIEEIKFVNNQQRIVHEPLVTCGTQLPPPFIGSQNKILVTFVAKENSQRRHKGFSFNFKEASCNKNYTTPSGRVTSPFFPEVYKHHLKCTIEITTPPGTKLSIFFRVFDLEQQSSCSYDSLQISKKVEDDWMQVAKLCQGLPNPIFFRNNFAKLVFETDESQAQQGFDITYTSSPTGCGGDLHVMAGVITSPNYPNVPFEPYSCIWTLETTAKRYMKLHISILPSEMTFTERCLGGQSLLTVFAGPDEVSPYTDYCINGDTEVTLPTSKLMVKYVSTESEQSNIAFKLTFTSSREFVAHVPTESYQEDDYSDNYDD